VALRNVADPVSPANSIYLEPGTYAANETFPLQIPPQVTVKADPANATDPSQVIIDGASRPSNQAAGPLTSLFLAGSLSGVTVTYSGKADGAVLIWMANGSPTVKDVTLVGGQQSGPVTVGVVVNPDGGDVSPELTSVDISGCLNGIEIGVPASASGTVTIEGSTIHGNFNDGLLVRPSDGALSLTLHDPSDVCVSGLGSGADGSANQFFCNGRFGIESQWTLGGSQPAVIDITGNQFMLDPPSAASASIGPPAGPNGPLPYDLNSCSDFLLGCNGPGVGSCTGDAGQLSCSEASSIGSTTATTANPVGTTLGGSNGGVGTGIGTGFGAGSGSPAGISSGAANGFGTGASTGGGMGGGTGLLGGTTLTLGGGSTGIQITTTNSIVGVADGVAHRSGASSNSPDGLGCSSSGGGRAALPVWMALLGWGIVGRRRVRTARSRAPRPRGRVDAG
jgi:hypothetical protein